MGLGAFHGVSAQAGLDAIKDQVNALSVIPQYLTWPRDKYPSNEGEALTMAVIGEVPDQFKTLLRAQLNKVEINHRGKKFKLKPEFVPSGNPDLATIATAHVIFVPSENMNDWLRITPQIALEGIMTVAHGGGMDFFDTGGVFNLRAPDQIEDHKIEVDLGNAKKAKVRINARLLQLAKKRR